MIDRIREWFTSKKNKEFLKLFGGDLHLHFHINLYKMIDETKEGK